MLKERRKKKEIKSRKQNELITINLTDFNLQSGRRKETYPTLFAIIYLLPSLA